jgi:hypothetical protein
MPIGSSKLGVLGAGLVPGGTETFNAPGTFSIPPGVKKVSITGTGGSGNPGNSGNSGNAGNIGFGGGGGGGGSANTGPANAFNRASCGGLAYSANPNTISGPGAAGGQRAQWLSAPAPYQRPVGNPGGTGGSGQAGSAGSCGCAGNPGCASTALGQTFNGGAGGNAGNAGAAGNGGSGGTGGVRGDPATGPNSGTTGAGGSGGNGGGPGGNGGPLAVISPRPQPFDSPVPPRAQGYGGHGGGGAGATNDGAGATNSPVVAFTPGSPSTVRGQAGMGGSTSNYSVPVSPNAPDITPIRYSSPITVNTTGGMGIASAYWRASSPYSSCGVCLGTAGFAIGGGSGGFNLRNPTNQPGVNIFCYTPAQPAFNAVRSGGGGGSGAGGVGIPCITSPNLNNASQFGGGGGGGGGRGNAGNAGGAGGAGGTGGAGTPATFNCVPVSPGTTTPITVGSPGGQIVISWNPQ